MRSLGVFKGNGDEETINPLPCGREGLNLGDSLGSATGTPCCPTWPLPPSISPRMKGYPGPHPDALPLTTDVTGPTPRHCSLGFKEEGGKEGHEFVSLGRASTHPRALSGRLGGFLLFWCPTPSRPFSLALHSLPNQPRQHGGRSHSEAAQEAGTVARPATSLCKRTA